MIVADVDDTRRIDSFDPEASDETATAIEMGLDGVSTQGHAAPGLGVTPREVPATAATGRRIGRYVLLEQLGAGAMGQVFMAYDPDLARPVAIKLLRPELTAGTKGERASPRSRLLREAQAAAQLVHPNVTTVYEVGVDDDKAFIAMEYVKGSDLRAWLNADRPRPWREVLDVFVQAGRGLAAAHKAGILHRDFKPDNVLVDEEGTAKVTDFGLATPMDKLDRPDVVAGEANDLDAHVSSLGIDSQLDVRMTQPGTVMGSPAYMPPEQHVSSDVDPRADQFAFCVALHEGLYGTRPFEGRSIRGLFRAKYEGKIVAPPTGTDVPSWVRAIVLRGLAPKVSDRWPSMAALLEALDADPEAARARRRTRIWLGISGVAVLAAAITVGITTNAARAQRCSGAGEALGAAWDEGRRDDISSAFAAVEAPYAAEVWAQLQPALDEYARAWTDAFTQACEATTIRGEQSQEVLELRMSCLRRLQVQFDAATAVLATADIEVAANAHDVVAQLPPIERCGDIDALRSGERPPLPKDAEAVQAARAALAKARAEQVAGHPRVAQTALEQARGLLEDVDHMPTRADLLTEEGSLLMDLGEYERALTKLDEALGTAVAQRDWRRTAAVMDLLIDCTSDRLQRFEGVERYAAMALALANEDPQTEIVVRTSLGNGYVRHGDDDIALGYYDEALELAKRHFPEDVVLQATILSNMGNAYRGKGDFDAATKRYESAIAMLSKKLGEGHPRVARAHMTLSSVHSDLARFDEAEAEASIAITALENAFGKTHPDVASAHNNLAIIKLTRGDFAAAENTHRKVLALRREALGDHHPEVAASYLNLGNTLQPQGKLEEAERMQRKALEILLEVHGPDHAMVSAAYNNLGSALFDQGKVDRAAQMYERALEIRKKTLGPRHPEVATTLNNLGIVHQILGDHARAIDEYEQALVIWAESLGPKHPNVAMGHANLGEALALAGKTERAREQFETALEIFTEVLDANNPAISYTRRLLAKTLLEAEKPDLSVALEQAERAWFFDRGDTTPPFTRAESAFLLARISWAANTNAGARRRAKQLARSASEDYLSAGSSFDAQRAEVDAWLTKH